MQVAAVKGTKDVVAAAARTDRRTLLICQAAGRDSSNPGGAGTEDGQLDLPIYVNNDFNKKKQA